MLVVNGASVWLSAFDGVNNKALFWCALLYLGTTRKMAAMQTGYGSGPATVIPSQ